MNYFDISTLDPKDPNLCLKLKVHVLEHQDIGGGTVRAICTINGINAKRLVTTSFGKESDPVWTLEDTIVNNDFANILEQQYQHYRSNNIIIIK